jgi:hypothetical protein
MLYLDTSALVKLTITEDETEALRSWLEESPEVPRLTSAIAKVELPRTVMRRQAGALFVAERLLAEIARVHVTREVLDTAKMLQPTPLRSLDAIHLASALTVYQHLTAFVSYDRRLLEAAESAGLPIASPA